MNRQEVIYWGLGTAGLFLVHYLASRQPRHALADTIGDLASTLPPPRNPVLRLATRRIVDRAEAICRSRVQAEPTAVPLRHPWPHQQESQVVDAEFTIIEGSEDPEEPL